MKTKADLVRGWLRKAESDLYAVHLCLEAEQALDTACFHAQQAAEKYLKAYLTAYDNLEKLIELCAGRDSSFVNIKTFG